MKKVLIFSFAILFSMFLPIYGNAEDQSDDSSIFSWLFDWALDTEVFEFELNEDQCSYTLTSYNVFSKYASEEANIPQTYNDLPVTIIGSGAFSSCKQIKSVIIPSSVTSIGSGAFRYCTNLTNIIIPESVHVIGSQAFECCDSLTSLYLPQNINVGYKAFTECANLKDVEIGTGGRDIAIGAASIEDYAFHKCSNLKRVTIGPRITYIGSNAFSHCESLSILTLSDNLLKFGDSAFEYCENLICINYSGTEKQWDKIDKWPWWDKDTGNYTIRYNQ